MTVSRGFTTNSGATAQDWRFFQAAMLQKNQDNSLRVGQLWGHANAVMPTSSMTVTVADGSYWAVSRGVSDGALVLANNGQATVTLPTAPASNSRYDTVWVKHDDSTFGDADSNPVFGVTSGTAAASPSIPTPPTGALRLANILVPAGVTATNASGVTVTNVYQFTALSGSPIRYRSVAELQADAGNVLDGGQAYIKGGGLYWMQSNIWHQMDADVFGVLTGTGTVPSGTTNIAFPGTSTSAYTATKNLIDLSAGATFVVAVPGYYKVSGTANWNSNSTGERFLEIMANGSSISPVRITDRKAASSTTDATLSGVAYCSAGDRITLYGWQNSGSAQNVAIRLSIKLLAVS